MSHKDVALSRHEVLCALDYLHYLDGRLDSVEDMCGEMSFKLASLQAWLESAIAGGRISTNDRP